MTGCQVCVTAGPSGALNQRGVALALWSRDDRIAKTTDDNGRFDDESR
jgi:hypothetical protein